MTSTVEHPSAGDPNLHAKLFWPEFSPDGDKVAVLGGLIDFTSEPEVPETSTLYDYDLATARFTDADVRDADAGPGRDRRGSSPRARRPASSWPGARSPGRRTADGCCTSCVRPATPRASWTIRSIDAAGGSPSSMLVRGVQSFDLGSRQLARWRAGRQARTRATGSGPPRRPPGGPRGSPTRPATGRARSRPPRTRPGTEVILSGPVRTLPRGSSSQSNAFGQRRLRAREAEGEQDEVRGDHLGRARDLAHRDPAVRAGLPQVTSAISIPVTCSLRPMNRRVVVAYRRGSSPHSAAASSWP